MLIDKTTSSIFASTIFIAILLREVILTHGSVERGLLGHNYLKQRFGNGNKFFLSMRTSIDSIDSRPFYYVYFHPVH